MNASIFDNRKALSGARIILVAAAALALAACQTDGTGPTVAAAPKPEVAKPPEPDKEPEEPMTRSRAARECWMKTEKSSARDDLDKRADIVNKCIDEKIKASAAPAPKS